MAAVLASVLVATGVAGCSDPPDRTVIALLLGSSTSTRWAVSDEPAFQERVEFSCPDCVYLTRNAEGDPDLQSDQLADVLREGADVVVLNAVSAEGGEELVARAGKVPVVAYDRFVAGADFFVSYDADAIGQQLAEGVVEQLRGKGVAWVINGAQTDANGVAIKRAVHQVLEKSEITIRAEVDPASWSAEEAGVWVANTLKKHPIKSVDAIIAANDTQAAGVADALVAAKVRPANWPVITGQDADLEALRRIIEGRQSLTVFKSFPREAQKAADISVALALGGAVSGAKPFEGVPSFVFDPIVVTLDTLTSTIVRDGIYSTEQLCSAELRRRCVQLGIR
jgi:ABC-type xylose transport system substrate-binding protein